MGASYAVTLPLYADDLSNTTLHESGAVVTTELSYMR